jgi:protein SCO1/2
MRLIYSYLHIATAFALKRTLGIYIHWQRRVWPSPWRGILLVLFLFLPACQPAKPSNAQRYELHGKIVAVDKANSQVTVSHESIPGYMDSMTMPFSVKSGALLNEMAAGDQIGATLVVDGSASWLEDIVVSRIDPSSAQTSPSTQIAPSPGDPVPGFPLVNQEGRKINLTQYKGKVVVLTFIYTRCPLPDYCILMNDNFSALERSSLDQPALRDKTHLLTVSFDPEHDTPAILKTFGEGRLPRSGAGSFAHWEFATGSSEEIQNIAKFFGITYMPDSGQFIHSLVTAVIAPDGKLYKLYRGNDWKPEDIEKDFNTLLSAEVAKQS